MQLRRSRTDPDASYTSFERAAQLLAGKLFGLFQFVPPSFYSARPRLSSACASMCIRFLVSVENQPTTANKLNYMFFLPFLHIPITVVVVVSVHYLGFRFLF